MADYEITDVIGLTGDPPERFSEALTVHLVEALTDAGTEFIDAYVYPDDTTRMLVLDSGRIVLHEQALPAFRQAATAAGLVEA